MNLLRKFKIKFKLFCHKSLKVGFFLAIRQLKRANVWTSSFIIFIMFLTFLNLIVVNGILIGLIEGSSRAYRVQYSGDILISKPENKEFIKDSQEIIKKIQNIEEIESISPRMLAGGRIIHDYTKKLKFAEVQDQTSAEVAGIDPDLEKKVTNIEELIIAGEYLDKSDKNYILVGSSLLKKYSEDLPGIESLEEEVDVGSKIKLLVGQNSKELEIKGILDSKIGQVGRRIYLVDSRLKELMEQEEKNVNEIAIKIKDEYTPEFVKDIILDKNIDPKYALVQTWDESQGEFLEDIKNTFSMLSNLIGAIGIIVSSITLFIVIFINAISRERFIGIMKGIGICGEAIQVSYIIQALFYIISGTTLGMLVLYGFLKPYIDKNPIDFPFSDGILVAPIEDVVFRIVILIIITIIASYIPSKMIIKKNTLNSILGRK